MVVALIWLAHLTMPTEPASSARSRAAVLRVRPTLERELAAQSLEWGAQSYLRIFKTERKLELWLRRSEGTCALFKSYDICSMSGSLGPKEREGDRQAPEGIYRFGPEAMNPWSSYHLSFNVRYPNRLDRQLGRTGGLIMVHGNCVSIGCFAMQDGPIEEIYALLEASFLAGQTSVRVDIFPFHLTQRNLDLYVDSPWRELWLDLSAIYQMFEVTHRVPRVMIREKRYRLED